MDMTDRLDEMYAEFLDECYPPVIVAGLEYDVSHTLARLDPVAYRCMYADWLDGQICDGYLFEHSDGSYHDCEELTECDGQ
jgi:hypothetical protein